MVETIRTGNSNIRNPILVSYVAKGLLPCHGLGSGIKRELGEWPSINLQVRLTIQDYLWSENTGLP